ncbi:MAG: hypothetical protein AAB453_00095, partial [Patescibacteria group bacterium]
LRLPATEPSIHASRVSTVKALDRVVHVAEKNEDTWYEILRHFNAGFDTTLSLPTGGQGVVVQMRSRTIPMAIRTCSRLIVTTVMA